jgi:hypothetical protein
VHNVDCNFIDLEIQIRTSNRAHLAVTLPLSGGFFAELCRNAACPFPGRTCNTCSQSADCDWYRVFGQVLSADPEALRRHQKPPLPFVFSFPMLDNLPASPGIVDCGLVVIGCAISCLGMLLDGFDRLLSNSFCRDQAEVVQLFLRDYQGELVSLVRNDSIAAAKNLIVLSLGGIMESRAWSSREVKIILLSPLKLRADGHQVKQFEFGRFGRSLLRRISSLNYYYEKCESECDFKDLSHQADSILCTQDAFFFDASPGGLKKLSGINGRGCFRGNFTELLPFLVAGSYFHVGTSAAFGMGRFELSTT